MRPHSGHIHLPAQHRQTESTKCGKCGAFGLTVGKLELEKDKNTQAKWKRLRSRHLHFAAQHRQTESTKCGKCGAFGLTVGELELEKDKNTQAKWKRLRSRHLHFAVGKLELGKEKRAQHRQTEKISWNHRNEGKYEMGL